MENLTETFYLSMILIGIGSFLFGILPIAFSFRGTRSYPFFLSLILCLGAGVLFATSLVHMLTEVQEKLKLNAQLYFCAGFLLLYTFDEISHYCLGSGKGEVHLVEEHEERRYKNGRFDVAQASSHSSENSPLLDTTQNKGCSSLPGVGHTEGRDSQKLFSQGKFSQQKITKALNAFLKQLGKCPVGHMFDMTGVHAAASWVEFESARTYQRDKEQPQQSPLDVYLSTDNVEANQIVCSTQTGEPGSSNSAAKTGLLIALLIHSILEGISIGVQTKTSQILLVLGAVTFHKIVLSFCLGLELRGSKKLHLLAAIFMFSIGSPIGISLGMTVTSFKNGIFGIDAELQAVAAGSLLYVAAFEVLPRERNKWQNNSRRRGAGILQLIFMLLGFICITVFHMFLGSADGGSTIVQNVTRKFH